jgi:hypothetical protein
LLLVGLSTQSNLCSTKLYLCLRIEDQIVEAKSKRGEDHTNVKYKNTCVRDLRLLSRCLRPLLFWIVTRYRLPVGNRKLWDSLSVSPSKFKQTFAERNDMLSRNVGNQISS